ncbi:C-factor-like isoform X2 [Argiope bruennichi]|uniref:C-factor-like isoform X2 n=1 Tax=Argiope bruennichi TaxID=94029 RepID=UPI002494F3ED|nr:C-factor-like isoform X2 [Argiope bruennichi]
MALKEIRDAFKNTQVVLIKMDVTKANEIEEARKIVESKVGEKGLNLLINNAGVLKMQGFSEITEENLLFHFSTNTIGPVIVLKEILPLLKKSADRNINGMKISRAAVVNIASGGGSIAGLTEQSNLFSRRFLDAMGYRISKAALNMAMRLIAVTIKGHGILVVNIWAGRMEHSLASNKGERTLSDGISEMLKTLQQLNDSQHGAFVDQHGKPVPF